MSENICTCFGKTSDAYCPKCSNLEIESELAPAGGMNSKPLFVEARIYNHVGNYRVVSIGGKGDCNSDMDGAKILRELASFVETRWKRKTETPTSSSPGR